MSKYASQTATALRLIKKKGVLLTFTHLVAAVPANVDLGTDVETPAENPAELTTSCWAVILPPNLRTQQTFEEEFATGTLTFSQVRRLFLSPVGASFLPLEGDTVTVSGLVWTLLGGKYLNPADDSVPIIGEFTLKQ